MSDNNIKKSYVISENLQQSFSKEFSTNKDINNIDIDNAVVLEFTDMDVKGIVANYTNAGNKSFITYYKDNEFRNSFILDIVETETVRKITISDEFEIPAFEVLANIETGKILEINKFGSDKKLTFNECFWMAYNSCMADPECSLWCQLVFPQCVAAMAGACAVTTW